MYIKHKVLQEQLMLMLPIKQCLCWVFGRKSKNIQYFNNLESLLFKEEQGNSPVLMIKLYWKQNLNIFLYYGTFLLLCFKRNVFSLHFVVPQTMFLIKEGKGCWGLNPVTGNRNEALETITPFHSEKRLCTGSYTNIRQYSYTNHLKVLCHYYFLLCYSYRININLLYM